ncbi:Gag protease polyprotein, putative [Theobroma cacao]|uniref:Gag protease polyprotein, putative n=1 Tax=Theobroma cacao TaxID=3641 RepID=A0A061GQR5_THECC|nr:Gag protease polyprotein, putative [Theobroma cacao]
MLPRRGLPPLTRSARRGKGRPRQNRPDPMEEESVASIIRVASAAEQPESPPHPPPPTGTPAMPPEMVQALAAFLTAMAGQAQAGQIRPIVSSDTSTILPMPDIPISKKLKEARQLGCVSFTVKSEQDQANYFEEGLCNEIRERMTVIGREPHKEVVQIALRVEKLANENKRMRAEIVKRRNPSGFSNQPLKKGHYRSDCSQLGRATIAISSPPARTNIQRKDSTKVQPRPGVTIRSDVESNAPAYPPPRPQTHMSTRIFAVAEDEARVQPGAVTGTTILIDKDAYALIDSDLDRKFEESLKDDIAPNGTIKSIKPRTSSNRNFKVKLRVSQFRDDSK